MKPIALRPRQQEALDWLYANYVGAVFGDLGTGKTLVILSLINALKVLGCRQTLIIAPKRVKANVWVPECAKFGFDLSISLSFEPNADVHIVNPASMHKIPDWTVYDTLIVDESTDFKNHGAKQFKALAASAALFGRRYILTGGPIPNGYHDMWAQIFLLDLGHRLGKNISTFRRNYCQRSYSGFGYDVVEREESTIDQRISDIVFRMDNSDLGLPPRHDIDIPIDLPDSVLKQYKSLEVKLFAEIEGRRVLAMDASAAYSKCKQFTGGFVYDDEKNPIRIHSEKLHHLGALHASRMYEPLLVVYQYTPEGKAIADRFSSPRIHGGTTDKKTDAILASWNRGEVPMLVCQIHTIAMGLNLQFGGSALVVYSVPDNFNDYFQVIGRLHRPGVKSDVYVYHLICRCTIDEAKLKPRLGRKESKQKVLLRSIRQYQKGTR